MKPAKYEIPIIIEPKHEPPHVRLYHNQTISSAQRIHVTNKVFSKEGHNESFHPKSDVRMAHKMILNREESPDSLDWILKSNYNHAADQFATKNEVFIVRENLNDVPLEDSKFQDYEPLSNNLHCKESMLVEGTSEVTKTHALTERRTKQGFTRNPNGSFYWD